MLLVQDVEFSISGLQILNRVTFRVGVGETVGIIGPNGSGKTTLFNSISGFNIPQAGKILFKGEDITAMAPFRRAGRGLGRVFQNAGVFREMSVLENIIVAIEGRQALVKTFWPWSKRNRQNREEALQFLKEVGLTERANEKASSLSGGQIRLLEIIRTLAFGADLFLLDEPTAGVSPKMKDDVAHLIKRLQQMNKTVLVIEHDINFIQKFCDRILVLDVGRVVLDDTPENIRQNELLHEIYFGADEERNNHRTPGVSAAKGSR